MLTGGGSLAVREIAGIALSLVATVIILRKVGPAAYGYVGVGLGLSGYLASVGALGLNVFLIRQRVLDPHAPREILTVVAVAAAAICAAVWLLAPSIEAWACKPGMVPMLRLVGFTVLFKIVGLVPLSLLERELKFKLAAGIDLASLAVYYAVVLPAVLLGWSYRGIWMANLAQTVAAAIGYFAFKPVVPTLKLHRAFLRGALQYGLGYQASVWTYSVRDLAAPLLLPRLAGMEALGVVTAATQLVQRMGFVRGIVWRLSISGLARVQDDVSAIRRSISTGMGFVVVLLGGALALFSSVSSWLVPLAFTRSWDAVPRIFPFLAMAALVNGVFTLHTSALFARGAVWPATKFHGAFVLCLWGASLVLIPPWGIWGYAAAEMVALAAYVYLGFLTRKALGSLEYGSALGVLPIVAVPLLLGPWLPPVVALLVWSAAAGCAVLLFGQVRTVLRESVRVMRRG